MQCPICEAEVAPNDTICRSCGAAVARENKPSATGLMVGAKLAEGHFSIGKVLGKGGFGITYLGSDLKLRRSVAIKELYPSGCLRVGDKVLPGGNWPEQRLATAKAKFLLEAQTLAQFQHPNICYVHGSFEENNTAYMVMEYIKGSTLLQILKAHGCFDEQNAVNSILQLCEAMRTIHAANVLHRDIKPGNVLLADDGRIVLIDFGTAREFAAGEANHMTTMLTPGYAPIEQYTQLGKLGPFTDIYSAGATLYHLLTGQQPIPATDQANGAVLIPPRQLNAGVSQTVSDAVMWAMQMNADQRPQTVDDFINGLAGRASGPVSRFTQGFERSLAAPSQGANPYKERIEAILAELQAGSGPAPKSSVDSQIDAVTSTLNALAATPLKSFPHCPSCGQAAMKEASGESGNNTCPICKNAKLNIREQVLRRCPVCRDGALESRAVDPNTTTCPVCRAATMTTEKRKKFGLAIDDWLVCPRCHAELNFVLGGQAKLVKVTDDPYGVGKKYHDQGLAVADWKKLSGARDKYLECGACGAHLDSSDDKGLTLTQVRIDPHNTASAYLGKKMSRTAWINIAEGFDPAAGNADCPGCHAEFNIDNDRQEITVLRSDEAHFPWSRKMWGKAFALKAWYLSEAGKRSMVPGWICSHCKTEFDKEDKNLKLMWTIAGPLVGHAGELHTAEGWQRIAAGLPTRTEEAKLRDKLTRLQIDKQKELDHFYKEEANHQAEIKEELDGLIRQAFVAGHVPILLKDTRIFLLDGETLYWESPAKRHQRMSVSGTRSWTLESRGVFALTNRRVIYDNKSVLWQHALDDIVQVEIDDSARTGMVVFTISGYGAAIAFEVTEAQFTVTTEFSNHTIRANPRDLVLLTMAIKQREGAEVAPAIEFVKR